MVHGWLFKLARHSRSCMTLHRPGQPKNLQNLLGSSPGMGACDLGRLWFVPPAHFRFLLQFFCLLWVVSQIHLGWFGGGGGDWTSQQTGSVHTLPIF